MVKALIRHSYVSYTPILSRQALDYQRPLFAFRIYPIHIHMLNTPVVANASHSEQSLQHRRVSSQWFALSCQAFQTQVVDCHDGYTILGLANGEATDESPIDSSLDGAKKSQHRDGSSFILWEYASA